MTGLGSTELTSGDRLVVNAACRPGGYLKVEVHAAADRTLPVLGLDDSDTFTCDSVNYTVTWRGDANMPLPQNADSGTVCTRFISHHWLRFVLRNAESYSFTIQQARAC